MSVADTVNNATLTARAFSAWLVEETHSTTDIEAQAAQVARVINDALVDVRALGLRGTRLHASLISLAGASAGAAQVAISQSAQIVEWVVSGDRSLFGIAFELYGDVERWAEIARLNEIHCPNHVPAGTTLRVYRE